MTDQRAPSDVAAERLADAALDHTGTWTEQDTLAATNPWTYATSYTHPATVYLKRVARYAPWR